MIEQTCQRVIGFTGESASCIVDATMYVFMVGIVLVGAWVAVKIAKGAL